MGIVHGTYVSTLWAIPVVMVRLLSLYLEDIRLQSHTRDREQDGMEEEGVIKEEEVKNTGKER